MALDTRSELPRPEHPRPQFFRDTWQNLNGTWTYRIDTGSSGHERGFAASRGFDDAIIVPFAPESPHSGVEHRDFIPAIWYHRRITPPEAWLEKRILLHFGAVDFECEAYVDGVLVGRHFGGTSSFTFDITAHVRPGAEHDLVVYAADDTRSGVQPGGKQSPRYDSYGCMYTRTTGIWQTVWLEATSPAGLESVQYLPDLHGGSLALLPWFRGDARNLRFHVEVSGDGRPAGETEVVATPGVPVGVTLRDLRLWSPEDPFLYDVTLSMLSDDGSLVDQVRSYAGIRSLRVVENRILLNERPLYLRLVLDQGFYPEGIWTAPSDAALRRDIELAQAAGFNGARLHQKVFEERFHYWADRLGYITWGESSSWGCDPNEPVAGRNFLSEWREIVVRDRNHPSIIAWTPFNETADARVREQHHRVHRDAYALCKQLDPTRPVNDASGYKHVVTDIWTIHDYTQDPAELRKHLEPTDPERMQGRNNEDAVRYAGQPYVIDEYGGIKWIPEEDQAWSETSWGYGNAPRTEEEFYQRLEELTNAVLERHHISGYCYTQLTDVEQEQNGIYGYDRSEKLDMERVRRVFTRDPDWWPKA
jgi:beta-galactosidase/beta-glucuronidase